MITNYKLQIKNYDNPGPALPPSRVTDTQKIWCFSQGVYKANVRAEATQVITER